MSWRATIVAAAVALCCWACFRPAHRLWAAEKPGKAGRPAATAKATKPAAADQPATDEKPTEPAEDSSPVVATVNGQKIHRDEVEGALAPLLEGRKLSAEALAQAQAVALAQLIDGYLVEQALASEGLVVSAAQVDAALAKVTSQLEAQKVTLDKYLEARRLTLGAFRRQISWKVLWEQAARQHLTDKMLEAYFQAHHKEFDGSEVRASHILLRPGKAGDQQATTALVKEAGVLAAQITAKKISFADAATRYSAGPSREKGGDIGFIPRHDLMVEQFAQAAFALEKGEISRPVVTPFGVHLIQVTDLAPGDKKWTEVREKLKAPAAKALFDSLAARQREKAQIEYSGAWPHFTPGKPKPGQDEPGKGETESIDPEMLKFDKADE